MTMKSADREYAARIIEGIISDKQSKGCANSCIECSKDSKGCARDPGGFEWKCKGILEKVIELLREPEPAADVQPVKKCRMIPLEPDCRDCTDVFICTNCHQHIHLGFIRKEYSGSYCLECGAEVKDGDTNG